jgi:hypothetical protein
LRSAEGDILQSSVLLPSFCERLRIPPTAVSVSGSLPVLFFGDAFSAQVATIGLNPSKFEYLDDAGNMLSGRQQRFATTISLGVDSRRALSDEQANRAIAIMRSYYDHGRPVYGSYFRHLQNFLGGMGMNFADRSATHLDLVQESTDPVWSGLSLVDREELLDRDVPFLVWQLENLPCLRAVICAGKTVSHQVRSRCSIQVNTTGEMKRIKWWVGQGVFGERELPIGGWNYPLDRPTGLGTVGELELGKLFGETLL